MKALTFFIILVFSNLCFANKIQQQGIKTAADCTTAGAALANCLPLDSQIYVTANGIDTQLSTAITNGTIGGGGGGGSLQWIEAANAPTPEVNSANNRVYAFAQGAGQNLYAIVKVPHQYGGSQVKLYLTVTSQDTSNALLMQTISTLIRPGTDQFNSTTNQRTSTNSSISLSGGTQGIPQQVVFDLTDSSGKINGVSLSGDNLIYVNLTRGSDSSTMDAFVMVYGAEATFH